MAHGPAGMNCSQAKCTMVPAMPAGPTLRKQTGRKFGPAARYSPGRDVPMYEAVRLDAYSTQGGGYLTPKQRRRWMKKNRHQQLAVLRATSGTGA
jgi:hypothetical protein